MAELPHIKNNIVNQERAEAVTGNLFKMQFFPPAGVPKAATVEQELVSITGLELLDATPEIIEQKAAGVQRKYMGVFVEETAITLTMTFNLNAHGPNANDVIIYRMMRGWRNKGRNPKTGANGLYKDYQGAGYLYCHNAVGTTWRTVDARQMFVANITGFDEVSIENGEPVQLVVEFVLNEWYDDLANEASA